MREALGKPPRIPGRKGAAKLLAHDQAEYAVAQKFQPFIVGAGRILPVRPVGQGPFQTFGTMETMTEDGLQPGAFLWSHHLANPRVLFGLFELVGRLFATAL